MAGCDVNIDFVYEHARVDLLRSAGAEPVVGVIVIEAEPEVLTRKTCTIWVKFFVKTVPASEPR
jgi:hypothetical protein